GLPIESEGTVGRENDSQVTGTCDITVAAGADGVLQETDCTLEVTKGGTIGTNGIEFTFSADGRKTKKKVRLKTATSYTPPYLGFTINFSAGTLVAGDKFTFTTTAPKWDTDGIAAAKVALAAQEHLARTILVVGDLADDTEGDAVVAAANSYASSNNRFGVARVQVRDRLPLAAKSKVKVEMRGSPNLTFAEVGGTGDTITRSSGSWVDDGFAVGMVVTVTDSVSNNVTGIIASLTALVLTFGTTDLANEGPVAGCHVVGSQGLTFAEVGGTGDTITRSGGGSWRDDGFRAGDTVTITGTASNNVSGAVTAVTDTVLTFDTTDLTAEVIGSHLVTITKGETMAAWVSEMEDEYVDIDDEPRIDIGLGRLSKLSPFTGWAMRRPVQWAVAVREFEHELHIPTWRKADGALDGWSMKDADGKKIEYDQSTDGGALEANFTCAKTWPNDKGAYIALSLTRAGDGKLLSRTHNMHGANLTCTIIQRESENAVGQVLELADDGHGTDDSRAKIEGRVNSALERELLSSGKEGPKASSVSWRADRSALLNVLPVRLPGKSRLVLDGTLEEIDTELLVS